MKKLFLTACIVWSLLAGLFGLLVASGFGDLESRKLRHETLQVLRALPRTGPDDDKLAYVTNLESGRESTGFLLFLTSGCLFLASVAGLRKAKPTPPAA